MMHRSVDEAIENLKKMSYASLI